MIIEAVFVASMLVSGTVLLAARGWPGWGALTAAPLVGFSAWILVAFCQALLFLPSTPWVTIVVVGVGVSVIVARLIRAGLADARLAWAAAGLGVLGAGATIALRAVNLVSWHNDSLDHIVISGLIARGQLAQGLTSYYIEKRELGVASLHAPAFLVGADVVGAIAPLTAASTIGVLAWLVHRAAARATVASATVAVGGVVVWILSINRIVFQSFYINGHLLVGGLLLLLAGGLWLIASGRAGSADRAIPTAVLLAIPAIVFTRPEGGMLAALTVVAALVHPATVRLRRRLLAVLGGSMAAWGIYVALVVVVLRHHRPTLASAAMGATGVAFIALAVLGERLPWPRMSRLAAVASGGVWVLAAFAFAVRPRLVSSSIEASVTNIARYWGWSLPVVMVFVAVTVALTRAGDQALVRVPVTTFVPFVLVLAVGRGGAYRVAEDDSLNRMWPQMIPLAIAVVALAVLDARPRDFVRRAWRRVVRQPARRSAPR